MPLGIEPFFEIFNLHPQFCSLVGVGHTHAMSRHLNNLRCGLDVGALEY